MQPVINRRPCCQKHKAYDRDPDHSGRSLDRSEHQRTHTPSSLCLPSFEGIPALQLPRLARLALLIEANSVATPPNAVTINLPLRKGYFTFMFCILVSGWLTNSIHQSKQALGNLLELSDLTLGFSHPTGHSPRDLVLCQPPPPRSHARSFRVIRL
jgi:hypothetical protein